jgi:hypothetical protein
MLERQKQETQNLRNLLFRKLQEGKGVEPSETGAIFLGIIEIVLQMVYEQDDAKTAIRDIGKEFNRQLKESHDELLEHIDAEREKGISPVAQKIINILLSALTCTSLFLGSLVWTRSETAIKVNADNTRLISVLQAIVDNNDRRIVEVEKELKRQR